MRRLLAYAIAVAFVAAPAQSETFVILPFSNLSGSSNLDWIGESICETIREALASEGEIALSREDRLEAFRRLSLKPDMALSMASLIKVGELLDADKIIHGRFHWTADPSGASKGSLRMTASIVDLKKIRRGPEFGEIGALEDLAALQTHLAWQSLQFLAPETAPSEQEFLKSRPKIRLDAMENYVRGLLAADPEQQHRFFTQAARLDPEFSQPCFRLGRMHWGKESYRVAASWLERVAAWDASYREASFLLGLSRYKMGDFAGAQKAFEVVAGSVPLNEVLNNLGAAQARTNHPHALDNFQKALEGDPKDPVYHFNVGYTLWKQGRFAAAAERFRAVLDRDPEDKEAMLMLGRSLKESGPRGPDPMSDGLERLKHNYEELAYWQLREVLGKSIRLK